MWFFRSPEIVFGEDALARLSELTGRRALIVTDAIIVQLGLTKPVVAQLTNAGIECQIFSEVEPDPSLATVQHCADVMTAYEPDWIVAVGGGSPLDTAKAAWFRYERPDVPIEAINPFEEFGLRRKARLITSSTTSGTGADVSWGVALREPNDRRKVMVAAPEMLADIAIVDPSLVVGLPPQITADTGMDVLTQAIEGYANAWHNDFTDGLCLKAIQIVFEFLPRAYADGSDMLAREKMHNAATMTGLGFTNTSVVLAHAMAHAFQATFHTPHGRTVGVCMPYTIAYNSQCDESRYADIARFLGLPASDETVGTASLIAAFRKLAQAVDQPITLKALNISEADLAAALPHMVELAANGPEIVACQRIPNEAELTRLFWCAYHGHEVDF